MRRKYTKETLCLATVLCVAGMNLFADSESVEAKKQARPPSRDPLLALMQQKNTVIPAASAPIYNQSSAPARQEIAYQAPITNQTYAAPNNTTQLDVIPATPIPAASVDGRVTASDAYVPPVGQNYVEAGINYHSVTDNYGNWFGQFVNAQYQTDPWNRWSLSLQHQNAFKDEGVSGGIGNTHIINEDWFTTAGISVGSDATFLNKYRVDASINRKLLPGKNLVATAGVTYSKAQQTYSDRGILLSAVYYTPSPWIFQGGVRFNWSDPGMVFAPSAFGAVTYGYNKRYYVTGKVGIAREAYQLLGPGTSIVNDFSSYNLGVDYRQWLGQNWGFNLGSEFYHNPAYDRLGGSASLFLEF